MATYETVNFGIVGAAGMIGGFHQQAIAANEAHGARLAAVSEYDPATYDELSQKLGVPCYSFEAMLADPNVDVITLCTPSGMHPQQTIAAARAGKHILTEKPMALTIDDADSMIAVCAEHRVKLGVVLQRRVDPLFKKVYDAIQAGDLGELTLAAVTIPYHRPPAYYNQADWRGTWKLDGGGVLMNQGIHLIDLLVWYMGDPVAIKAFGGTLHRPIEVEDTIGATLHFANGSVATVTATTTADPGFPHRVEVYGTNGGIQIEGESLGRWTLADASKGTIEPPAAGGADDAGAGADPRGIQASGHITLFRDFMEALRQDRAPLVDGREGRRSVAAILGMYRAAGLIE